jgi:hypothetical protein
MTIWVIISGATISGAAAWYRGELKAAGFLFAFAVGFAANAPPAERSDQAP